MNQKIKTILKSVFVLVAAALSVTALAVWQGPTAVAPGNNVTPPINVGTASQVKNGSLGLTGAISAGAGLFSYLKLDFYDHNNLTCGSSAMVGAQRYNTTTKLMEFCNGIVWAPIGGGAGPSGPWAKVGANIFNIGIPNTDKIGIGTATPSNKLSVLGGADFSGSVGIGMAVPINKLSVLGNADFSGSVGIGTTAPVALLSLKQTGSTATSGFGLNSGDVWTTIRNLPSTNSTAIDVTSGGTTTTMGTAGYNLVLNPSKGNVAIGKLAASNNPGISYPAPLCADVNGNIIFCNPPVNVTLVQTAYNTHDPCHLSTSASYNITATGGIPPYTYSWNMTGDGNTYSGSTNLVSHSYSDAAVQSSFQVLVSATVIDSTGVSAHTTTFFFVPAMLRYTQNHLCPA